MYLYRNSKYDTLEAANAQRDADLNHLATAEERGIAYKIQNGRIMSNITGLNVPVDDATVEGIKADLKQAYFNWFGDTSEPVELPDDATLYDYVLVDGDLVRTGFVASRVNLTPRQFSYFTARWGYDDAITAVLSALKANDIETYAQVKADVEGAGEYRFDNVLAVIGNPVVAPVIPEGVDVSAETLAARWLEAVNV